MDRSGDRHVGDETTAPKPADPAADGEVSGGFRQLLSFARPHAASIALVLLLTFGSSAASLAQPIVMEDILLDIGTGASISGHISWLVALLVVSALLTALTIWFTSRTSEQVVLGLRRGMLHRLFRLEVGETDTRSAGDLATRVTSDTAAVQQAASTGLVQVLDGVFTIVVAGALMAVLEVRLFLVTLGVLVAVVFMAFFVMPRITRASRDVQHEIGRIGERVERVLAAARTVKSNTAEQTETRTAVEHAERACRAGVRGAKFDAATGVLSGVAIQGSVILVLGVGGAMVADGALDIATLIAFMMYLFRLIGPIASLATGVTLVFQGLGAVGRLAEVSTLRVEEDVDGPGGLDDEAAPPVVELRGVSFTYEGRTEVLTGVDLVARAGEQTAVVGPSGGGKSTIFGLVERFYEPSSGAVLLDGVDVAGMPRSVVRRRVAYVEQDPTLLAGTIAENVRYGSPTASDDDVARVIEQVRLTGFVQELPRGLHTQVGARGAQLSGGQRQRLAIARALLRRPTVLLLDEATSSLDAHSEEALRHTVEAVSAHCTVLVIAHRLSTVRSAHRIHVLEAGRVRAVGRHEELLVRDDLYRSLAETQFLA